MPRSIVGIVGDLHAPFTHPKYMRFIEDTFEAWGVNKVVFIGDIVDHHHLSFHEHDPGGYGADEEYKRASKDVAAWYERWPKALVTVGNHDARHFRVARSAGMPEHYVRDYRDVWNTPLWDWQFQHEIDGVLYEHGTGSHGRDAAFLRAVHKRRSVVMGHVHSGGGVKYHTNDRDRIFGLNVGCGIDIRAYAFAYGKDSPVRPTLGCGIVVDGVYAYFEPMPLEQPRYRR